MKATIEADQRYNITIAGIKHTGFSKVSEWEGMAKFKNEQGVVIVDLGTDLVQDFVGKVFGEMLGSKPYPIEVEVLKVSPSLAGAGE